MRARWMRVVASFVIGAALLGGSARTSTAQGTSEQTDLEQSGDFRLRVSAALVIGRQKQPGARAALEKALRDPHPAVRLAAVAGLEALGDAAAIPALEQRARSESSTSVAAQMKTTIANLRKAPPSLASARYALQLGNMKNNTNIRGEEFSSLMRTAAKTQVATLPGAYFVDATDSASLRQAGAQHIPVLLLDGALMRLAQGASNGNVTFQAQVEFSVRRVPEQTLRGTLSGAATTFDSVRVLGNRSRINELQDQAVNGAVESAMRGADRGLVAAAR